MTMTRRSDHNPGTIVLDLRLDTSAIERVFNHMAEVAREASRTINRGMRHMTRVLQRIHAAAVEAANDDLVVAGLEARYLVRAGLAAEYASPEDLDALVASIMRGEAEDTRLLTIPNRALVAAAALRGWTHVNPAPVPVLAWHRLLGGTAVVVTRG